LAHLCDIARRWELARLADLQKATHCNPSEGVRARVRAAATGMAWGEWLAAQAAHEADPAKACQALKMLRLAAADDEGARKLARSEALARNSSVTTQARTVSDVLSSRVEPTQDEADADDGPEFEADEA
jgi:hypothetical protein